MSEGKRNEYLLEAAFRRFFLPYFRYYCTSLLQKSNKNTLFELFEKLVGPAKVQKNKPNRPKTMAQNSSLFFFFFSLFCFVETRFVFCVGHKDPPVVFVLQQRGIKMGKRKRPWLNETHLKNEEERRRVKQKERAERNNGFGRSADARRKMRRNGPLLDLRTRVTEKEKKGRETKKEEKTRKPGLSP